MSNRLARLARLRAIDAHAAARVARGLAEQATRAAEALARVDALLAARSCAVQGAEGRAAPNTPGCDLAAGARLRAALRVARSAAISHARMAGRQAADAELARRLTHSRRDRVEAALQRDAAAAHAHAERRLAEEMPVWHGACFAETQSLLETILGDHARGPPPDRDCRIGGPGARIDAGT